PIAGQTPAFGEVVREPHPDVVAERQLIGAEREVHRPDCMVRAMTDELLFERRQSVAWVTLNRPEVRNALTPDMRNRLIEVVEEVGGDPELRCLVLTGAGEGFCTGADIRGTSKRQGSGERVAGAARDVIVNGVQRLFRAMWNL